MASLDGVFFIKAAPTIQYRDGHFHCCFEVGRKATFEIVMSPNVFLKALSAASELGAKWQVGELDRVKPLGRLGRGH